MIDQRYKDLLSNILKNGTQKGDRTGTGTKSITGAMVQHNMADGFPILTTKRIAFKTMSVELEGFLKGITDKRWYKDRGCNIWNSWSRPDIIPEGISDEERKKIQLESNDLGPIYGAQWRNFNGAGYDQLGVVLNSLENKPNDRRMVVSAWNPLQLHQMALPPCHLLFQVVVRGEFLDLVWYQRSVDIFLGLPFNIASYGLILSLLTKQFNYKPGILTGFLGDTHIYNNHIKQVEELLSRELYPLPTLNISADFKDIREFDHSMVSLDGYKYHPTIKAPVAI